MKESIELLKTLTDVNGIAGMNTKLKRKMRDYLTPISDEIIEDGLVVSSVKRKVKRDLNH